MTGKRSAWLGTDGVSAPTATENSVVTGAMHKGFLGSLICAGEDCNSPADDDAEFAGSWYFYVTGAPATADWVKNPDEDDEYVQRSSQPHADWGVWLADEAPSQPGKIIEWYYSAGPALQTGSYADKSSSGASNTAKYTGNAVGVSTLYETQEGRNDEKVGSFTATAELTASFLSTGVTTPTVSGKITDFKGNAVNTGWELELLSSAIDTSNGRLAAVAPNTTNQSTRANRADHGDSWDVQFYGTGTDGDRPAGVVGAFDGRFRDGQAVGVFHVD